MEYFRIVIILVILLSVIAGGAYYLTKRFVLFFPVFTFRGWLFGFIGATMLFIGGSLLFSSSSHSIGKIIYAIGTLWLAVLLYLLLSLVIVDLLNLLIKMKPIIRGIVTLVLTFLIVIYGVFNAVTTRVKEVTIPMEGLTKEIRAVHITDMHLGAFWGEKRIQKTVDKIIELNPDVVFDTGDFFESKTHFNENSNVLESFEKFNIPYYFVHGNHDEYVGVDEAVNRLKLAGATVLRNELGYFGELQIVGLDNMLEDENSFDMHTKRSDETIKSVLSKLPMDEKRPTIVLHHKPVGITYMEDKKVDLLLSGHTHGGQLFPTSVIQELTMPYNKGLHQYKDMNVYISQGVGSLLPYVRVGTNSEITLIHLVPK